MLYLAIDQHRKQLTIQVREESGAVTRAAAGQHAVGEGPGVFPVPVERCRRGRLCRDRGSLRFQRLAAGDVA